MDSFIVLVRISGILCLLIGVSALNKSYITKVLADLEREAAAFWFMGFIAALLGLIMLSIYSQWSASWMVLVTILGWLATIKGVLIMLFPYSYWHSVYRKLKFGWVIILSALVSIVFGIVLIYQGFLK